MVQYDIPRRLKKKKGFFGTFENLDVFLAAGIVGIGVVMALIFSGIAGVIAIGVCGLAAYFLFIMQDHYGENFRIRFLREQARKKRQNIYYYYRGSAPKK